MWTVADFGKWTGKSYTLPQILVKDPDWFFWAYREKVFRDALVADAALLHQRATRIRIRKPDPAAWRIEYIIDFSGIFVGFDVVPATKGPHVGSSTMMRSTWLDLSYPTRLRNYDKLGCRMLMRRFQADWLNGRRMTKRVVEDFFSDPANFV